MEQTLIDVVVVELEAKSVNMLVQAALVTVVVAAETVAELKLHQKESL